MSNKSNLSRSEQVRRRRAERSTKELQETKTRALKPMVKVTSRTPTIPIAVAPKQKSRRRFNASLGLPSMQLHKPKLSLPQFSMPRFHMNWRMASLLIALLLGVGIYLVLSLPYFHVPAATVLGNSRLSREEINGVLGVSGESIFTIQPEEVRTRLLLSYPELLSAEVKVSLPNQVRVTVVERQPILFWQQEGEGVTWIDANGVAFRPRGVVEGLASVLALDAPPAGLPSDDPLSPPSYMAQDLVEAIRLLAPLVPANTTLTYSAADGLGWDDPRGWRVVFGTGAQDMLLKVRIYQSLVDSLAARQITPEFISVVHPHGPYYRMADVDESTEEVIDSGQ